MQTGTRAPARAETPAETPAELDAGSVTVPRPGSDGTLLAVVPIPGTGTSLAIVGYPVTAAGTLAGVTGLVPDGFVPGEAVRAVLTGGGTLPAGAVLAGGGTLPAGTVLPAQAGAGLSGLRLDHDQRRVWADGTEVPLTFQEFELLAFLAAHPSTVFSRADLVREVWQRDFAADSRTVDVHVSRLRHKLGPAYGRWLVTEYRVGYQFRAPNPEA